MTTTGKTITLVDFINDHDATELFYASIGVPTGSTIRLDVDIDPETDEEYEIDPWDREQQIGEWYRLEGTVSDDGKSWEWDGEGNPTDCNRNTVTLMRASK